MARQRAREARQRRRAVASQQSYNRAQAANSRVYNSSKVEGFNADLGRLTVSRAGGSVSFRAVGQAAIGSTVPAGNGQALGFIS